MRPARPEPVTERDHGLNDADREQGKKGHDEETAVQPQERELQNAVIPVFFLHQTPPGKQEKRDGEHAVGPEEGRMTMVHGQVRSVLIVVDDRKIDEETENPAPRKFQKEDAARK